MGETICGSRRELARRGSAGIEVTLYWCEHDGSTTVEIRHVASHQTRVFAVAPVHALEAFYHPYAYVAGDVDELTPALT